MLSKEILIAACVASLAAPLFTGCSSQTQPASGGQETVSAETTASGVAVMLGVDTVISIFILIGIWRRVFKDKIDFEQMRQEW